MNQTQQPDKDTFKHTNIEEFKLLDMLIVLARRKKFIIGVPVAVAVVTAVLSFAIPNVYRAGAKLLPPQQAQSGAAAILSQLGGAAGAAAGAAGIKNPNDLYIGMLKSRTITDRIVAKFDLRKVYETDSLEKARFQLESNTFINSGKDNLITIEVEDEDRKKVAPLANAYVEELIRLTGTLAVTEASQRRVFFERQLEKAKDQLATAETKLKSRLDTRGVVSVDADSRAILETVSRVRALVSAKEIQLSSMQAFVTAANPEYHRVQEELNSLKSELSKLENGRLPDPQALKSENGNAEGLESIKILRDVKYYQMLYELLAKQYEVARLDEAKDSAVIQVLDPAVDPERKFKPKRAIIVISVTLIAALLTLAGIFLHQSIRQLSTTRQGATKWAELIGLFSMRKDK